MPEVSELLSRAAETLIVRWKQKKPNIKVVWNKIRITFFMVDNIESTL